MELDISVKPILQELKIEVTHKCPLSCLHCSSEASIGSGISINKTTCMTIIDEAASMGVKEIAFSGGEPLLWDGINDVVQRASTNAIRTSLYTSGNLNNVDARLAELKAVGLSKVVFSLFSDNPEDHELITRINGSYKKTLDAIRKSVAASLDTELHFVAMSRNYRALPGVVLLGHDLGIDSVSVLRFVPQGRGSLLGGEVLRRIENVELKQTIVELRSKGYAIRTGSPFNVLGLNDQPKCTAGITRLLVGPDLKIYPCDAFKQINYTELSNEEDPCSIADNGLIECWENSSYLSLIRKHLAAQYSELCNSCSIINRCLSGCLAQKVLATGYLSSGPDPACLRHIV